MTKPDNKPEPGPRKLPAQRFFPSSARPADQQPAEVIPIVPPPGPSTVEPWDNSEPTTHQLHRGRSPFKKRNAAKRIEAMKMNPSGPTPSVPNNATLTPPDGENQ